MPHRHLGHQRLLNGATEDGLETSVAAHLLTDVVHDGHDRVLAPPLGVVDGLHFTAHDNDLSSGDELSATVSRAQVLGHSRGGDIAVQRLGKTGDELVTLAGRKGRGRVRCEHEVTVEVHDESVVWSGEEGPAFGGDTENVGARLLNKLLGMASMNNRHVETAPLIDADTVPDGLGSHREHGGVVAHEDNTAGRGDGGLDDADDVGDGETREQGPHGEVLKACRRGGKLVAEGIVLHVDTDKVIEPRGGETQDAGNLLRVEQVGSLVPVNPHAPEVVAK